MKILVKITKIEDGFTYYDEICSTTGKVMISDYLENDRFEKAQNLSNLVCFVVINPTKLTNKREKVGCNELRGKVFMTVNVFNIESVEGVEKIFESHGFECHTYNQDENVISLDYVVDSDCLFYFNEAYKLIKKIYK